MDSSLHIRQGWLRALVFFFVGLVISGIFATITGEIIERGIFGGTITFRGTLIGTLIFYLVNNIGLLFCLWYFRRVIDRQSVGSLGLSWKGFGSDALLGFVVAVATLSLGTFLLYLGGNLTIRGFSFDAQNVMVAILFYVIVAFSEELIIRGYILNSMMESMNRWPALFVSAILFTLMHVSNPEITPLAGLNIFLAGILLGINYIYTKNLWFAIFFHFGWNFFQGTVLGYHVSGVDVEQGFLRTYTNGPDLITGGSFGFEGSIFAAILQVIVIALLTIYFEKKYGYRILWALENDKGKTEEVVLTEEETPVVEDSVD
ncbi:CPBP family intramembrane glutamic endopeptidase [Parasediminibacterium sp. JCM 36343]|uniref:CPBP family intramembrane glutamic endopeptidase n=1 Tax=Parasediminibacterium sp. JCM 36343 TaxID=3374279 RepID=UPI00397AC0F7